MGDNHCASFVIFAEAHIRLGKHFLSVSRVVNKRCSIPLHLYMHVNAICVHGYLVVKNQIVFLIAIYQY